MKFFIRCIRKNFFLSNSCFQTFIIVVIIKLKQYPQGLEYLRPCKLEENCKLNLCEKNYNKENLNVPNPPEGV